MSRPATESDPLLTRVAIGRSDNGSQFGMFLQVFADGTVLDGEGTHHVSRETLRPLVEAIQGGCTTLATVSDRTRAGTGCGSCRGQVAGLLLKHAAAAP